MGVVRRVVLGGPSRGLDVMGVVGPLLLAMPVFSGGARLYRLIRGAIIIGVVFVFVFAGGARVWLDVGTCHG